MPDDLAKRIEDLKERTGSKQSLSEYARFWVRFGVFMDETRLLFAEDSEAPLEFLDAVRRMREAEEE